MNVAFWIIYLIVLIVLPIIVFVVAYLILKKAIKTGIVDAYKEIEKIKQQS